MHWNGCITHGPYVHLEVLRFCCYIFLDLCLIHIKLYFLVILKRVSFLFYDPSISTHPIQDRTRPSNASPPSRHTLGSFPMISEILDSHLKDSQPALPFIPFEPIHITSSTHPLNYSIYLINLYSHLRPLLSYSTPQKTPLTSRNEKWRSKPSLIFTTSPLFPKSVTQDTCREKKRRKKKPCLSADHRKFLLVLIDRKER